MARTPRTPDHSIWSSALEEKCAREEDKLNKRLSKQLRKDLQKLLDDGIEADIAVSLGSHNLQLHQCIVQGRCSRLWTDVFYPLGGSMAITLPQDVISRRDLDQLMRFLYTEDNLHTVAPILDDLVTKCEQQGIRRDVPSPHLAVNKAFLEANGDQAVADYHSDTEAQQAAATADTQVPAAYEPPGQQGELGNRSPRACDGPGNHKRPSQLPLDSFCYEDCENNDALDACCALGRDLLKLFVMRTHTDVVIRVKDRQFEAHRCLLCARCSYFAAMLGGTWRESTAREIHLEGISGEAMEQVLLYIYGGCCPLAADCNQTELVTIADMYGLDGLKDIITYQLKKRCHFFHKPCIGCVPEVIATLPMAYTFGLDELWENGSRWCSRHFVRVWGAKNFATLPQEILDKCLELTIAEINSNTVIDLVSDCDRLTGSLTRVRWSEPVVTMAQALMDACVDHIKRSFVRICATSKFLSLGKTMALGLTFLEDVFGRAIITMPTSKACATYAAVYKLHETCSSEGCDWSADFKHLVNCLKEKCEHFMRLYINQLINTTEWNSLLTAQQQDQIQESAWYVCVGEDRAARVPPPVKAQQTSSGAYCGHKVGTDGVKTSGARAAGAAARKQGHVAAKSRLVRPKVIASRQNGSEGGQAEEAPRARPGGPSPEDSAATHSSRTFRAIQSASSQDKAGEDLVPRGLQQPGDQVGHTVRQPQVRPAAPGPLGAAEHRPLASGATGHRSSTSGATGHRTSTSGATQHRTSTSGATQHGTSTSGATQHRTSTSGATQHGTSTSGATQHGTSSSGATQHGTSTGGATQHRTSTSGAIQHRTSTSSTTGHHTTGSGATEHHPPAGGAKAVVAVTSPAKCKLPTRGTAPRRLGFPTPESLTSDKPTGSKHSADTGSKHTPDTGSKHTPDTHLPLKKSLSSPRGSSSKASFLPVRRSRDSLSRLSALPARVDSSCSMLSYPSNAATVSSSSLTTPSSDCGGSTFSSSNSFSDVFSSPEKESVLPRGSHEAFWNHIPSARVSDAHTPSDSDAAVTQPIPDPEPCKLQESSHKGAVFTTILATDLVWSFTED